MLSLFRGWPLALYTPRCVLNMNLDSCGIVPASKHRNCVNSLTPKKMNFQTTFQVLGAFKSVDLFAVVPAEEIPLDSVIFSELNKTVKLNRTVWNEWQRPTCNVFDGHSQLRRQILRTMQDCQKTKSTDLNRKLLLGWKHVGRGSTQPFLQEKNRLHLRSSPECNSDSMYSCRGLYAQFDI